MTGEFQTIPDISGELGESPASGNDNYDLLANKPKICGVTLKGDKSAADLGLTTAAFAEELSARLTEAEEGLALKADADSVPSALSQLANDAGFVTAEEAAAQVGSFFSGINRGAVFRGSDITADFDSGAFSRHLADGSFYNIYIGDRIRKTVQIGGASCEITGYIADLDTFYSAGNAAALNDHHAALVLTGLPEHSMMNSTDSTIYGYIGTGMQYWLLNTVLPALKAAFGENHILSHKKHFTTGLSAWSWQDGEISLMSETQVYGTSVWSQMKHNVGEAYKQLSLFRFMNPARLTGGNFWLRDISSETRFCAFFDGGANCSAPSELSGTVPLILIK